MIAKASASNLATLVCGEYFSQLFLWKMKSSRNIPAFGDDSADEWYIFYLRFVFPWGLVCEGLMSASNVGSKPSDIIKFGFVLLLRSIEETVDKKLSFLFIDIFIKWGLLKYVKLEFKWIGAIELVAGQSSLESRCVHVARFHLKHIQLWKSSRSAKCQNMKNISRYLSWCGGISPGEGG